MVAKLSLGLVALAGSALGADLPALTMKGSKFFYENGTQFFMKGVAYQQDTAAAGQAVDSDNFIDPLADEDRCKVDVPLLAELGTNIIRTYAIDPTADHSACMKLLIDNGIYVVSDLGQPSLSINRDDPQWNTELFARYTDVVDELSQYSNVMGFFAGNEVSNNNTNTPASAYVKAAVRDTKKYIKDLGLDHWMGVGYAANDDPDIRIDMAQYFNCGDETDAIDFWGYNIYSWCGESDMQKSGYSDQAEFFSNYSVPVFFAEYGCNKPDGAEGRIFQETGALYEDEMTEVFSGGIVYMYFQEDNDYGLVTVKGDTATKGADFKFLKKEVNAADPKGVNADDYTSTNKASECPSQSENWKVSEVLPPTPDSSLCKCMVQSRSCVKSKGLSTKKYGDMFGFICGEAPDLCKAINGNATLGNYGAYSMCSDGDKLDYLLDAYYNDQDGAEDACDFDGNASLQDAKDDTTCNKSLEDADDHNSLIATATSPADPASETGSGSGDDAEDFGMPGATMARVFALGDYAVGLYMVVALGVGASMVVL